MPDIQADTFQIESSAVDTSKIEDGSILDEDVATNADIQQSKISGLVTDLANRLSKSGGTASGALFGVDAVNTLDAITKHQVDEIFSQLTQAIAFRAKYPNVTQLVPGSNTITVTGYRLISKTGASLISTNSTNLTLNSPSPNTQYYLYAGSLGLEFSSTSPLFNGVHPTQNLIYITTVFTNSSSTIRPFILKSGYYSFTTDQVMMPDMGILADRPTGTYTLNLQSWVSPFAPIAQLSYFGASSTAASSVVFNTYASLTSSLIQDSRYCTGYNGAGGGNNQGQGMMGNSMIYLDNRQVRVNISTSGTFRNNIRLCGFYELWF